MALPTNVPCPGKTKNSTGFSGFARNHAVEQQWKPAPVVSVQLARKALSEHDPSRGFMP